MDAFWLPLGLIFTSALVAALVKRYVKDPCLKVFHRSFVFLKLKDGPWISGRLRVYSNCLELQFDQPQPAGEKYQKWSYILYEHNLDSIDRLLRPSPPEHTSARLEWEAALKELQHPCWSHRCLRKIRNGFNMLRDAFSQSIAILFGTLKRRTRLATLPLDEAKVTEMGRSLMTTVPNAYEPILEEYRGNSVVVETAAPGKIFQQVGILEEYSAKYILVRDADLLPELPVEISQRALFKGRFDVVFPRSINAVRHLARPLPHTPLSG